MASAIASCDATAARVFLSRNLQARRYASLNALADMSASAEIASSQANFFAVAGSPRRVIALARLAQRRYVHGRSCQPADPLRERPGRPPGRFLFGTFC